MPAPFRIVGDKVEAVPANGETNCWQVRHLPPENQHYTAAADLAEGMLSDTNNSASDPDYSAIAVYNRTTNRIDAIWHGRMDAELVAEELWKAGKWYNTAWITPEINGPGLAALLHLKRLKYPRLYKRQRFDDRIACENSKPLGWRTTLSNRDQLIDDWITAVRPDGEGRFDCSQEYAVG